MQGDAWWVWWVRTALLYTSSLVLLVPPTTFRLFCEYNKSYQEGYAPLLHGQKGVSPPGTAGQPTKAQVPNSDPSRSSQKGVLGGQEGILLTIYNTVYKNTPGYTPPPQINIGQKGQKHNSTVEHA